jgi:hypothetical protein
MVSAWQYQACYFSRGITKRPVTGAMKHRRTDYCVRRTKCRDATRPVTGFSSAQAGRFSYLDHFLFHQTVAAANGCAVVLTYHETPRMVDF